MGSVPGSNRIMSDAMSPISQRMRNTGFVCVAVWLTALAAVGTGARQAPAADAKKLVNPVKATPESVASGEQLYKKYCSFCHNPDGKGHGPMAPKGTNPSDLTDPKWDNGSTDGEIFAAIRNGVGPKFDMKPYKDRIPERDIWNLVNYLRSLNATRK